MADQSEVAHVVYPSARIQEVFTGSKKRVKALCGAMVSHRTGSDAPICRACFNEYDKLDLVGGEPAGRTAPPAGSTAPSDA